jgi:hypothetical protein
MNAPTPVDGSRHAMATGDRHANARWPGPRVMLAAVLLATASIGASFDDSSANAIPAGTRLTFHVTAPISSSESKTGQPFAFVLSAPITAGPRSIPVDGTTGLGTIFLAGHAGTSGHEGDLTLRLDSLRTSDGHVVTFDDQRFQINGRNRKIVSGVLGLIPYVGIGSHFIRGSEVRVDPATPIETVILRPARLMSATDAEPSFSARPSPSPSLDPNQGAYPRSSPSPSPT